VADCDAPEGDGVFEGGWFEEDDCPAAVKAVIRTKTVGRITRLFGLIKEKDLKIADSRKHKSERTCSL